MPLATRLMPYDLYERHVVVGRLLAAALPPEVPAEVLDVGGRRDLLGRFLPYPTLSINPDGTGHIVGDGSRLPFSANSFAAVVNIDTLEHLPETTRLPFIRECLRVSRRSVIVAAPFGSEAHIQREKELHELYAGTVGRPHPYLSEHVEHGLPSPGQLAALVQALAPARCQLYYAGDYAWQGRSFARAVQAHRQPRLLARFTNLYNRLSGLALFHPIALTSSPTPTTNRFYLAVNKAG